jgi:excisionase family DNA binding protein
MSTIHKDPDGNRHGPIRQRAMNIHQFCERYNLGRTTAYEQIKLGRLRALKCGKRTIITEDHAEEWLRSLPSLERNGCAGRDVGENGHVH